MKRLFLLFSIAVVSLPVHVHAQQSQQRSPSQIAVEVSGEVGYLSAFAEQEGVVIQQLQKQLADSQARVKELQEKYEPKSPVPSDAH